MKVLIVAPTFFPENDVGIFRMTTLADYLAGIGENVAVIRKDISGIHETENVPYKNLQTVEEIKVKDNAKFIYGCKNYKNKIIEYCKNNHVDIIIYTCAPYYAMKIAPEIKKAIKIPYIIDIRDFWLKNDEESKITVIKQNLMYPLKWLLQNRAFKHASNVIVVSENMKKKYEKYFHNYKQKFRIIFNGYDDQRVFKDQYSLDGFLNDEIENENIIKIGYSGVICQYSKKFAGNLLQAINNINEKGYKIKLFHMGRYEKEVDEILKSKKLNPEIYQYLGYVPNEYCVELLKKMDANAIINFRKRGLGTKVFDYLYCEKFILYVGILKTELADFLKEKGNAIICEDISEIEKYIVELKKDVQCSIKIGVGQYRRSIQNERYFQIILEAIEEKDMAL